MNRLHRPTALIHPLRRWHTSKLTTTVQRKILQISTVHYSVTSFVQPLSTHCRPRCRHLCGTTHPLPTSAFHTSTQCQYTYDHLCPRPRVVPVLPDTAHMSLVTLTDLFNKKRNILAGQSMVHDWLSIVQDACLGWDSLLPSYYIVRVYVLHVIYMPMYNCHMSICGCDILCVEISDPVLRNVYPWFKYHLRKFIFLCEKGIT